MMCNSVIFSKNKVEDINDLIKKNIDSRLYLFAYYNPKAKEDDKTVELNFWKGVTNIYGLFQDCAAFIKAADKHDLLGIFLSRNIINQYTDKKLRNFIEKINAFRTIFSHNIYMEYSKDIHNMELCQITFSEVLGKEIILNDISDISLHEDQWSIMLDFFERESESCIQTFYEAIGKISQNDQKSEIVHDWIDIIIGWYKKKIDDLLYRAIYNQFMLYCTLQMKNGKIYDKKTPINEWIKCKKSDILEKINDVYNNKDISSMLPLEFINALIVETNPNEFWDSYYNGKQKVLLN